MQDVDREIWDRAWASMPHRRMETWASDLTDWWGLNDFGELIRATISQTPEEYIAQMYTPTDRCPVCGIRPEVAKRISVSVNGTFAGGLKLGLTSWAHVECFENCPLIDGPSPIPW